MATEAERQLVSSAASGNLEALHKLVFGLYRAYLCGVVKRHKAGCTDEEIEETLHAFYDFITTPTASGSYRLRNLDKGESPRVYMARALDNRLCDILEAESRGPVVYADIDAGKSAQMCADNAGAAEAAMREAEIKVLIMTLEHSRRFSARDRYILFTYLLAERFAGEGRPLRLSEMLGEQLGMKPSTVYNCYDRAIKRLRREARQMLSDITDTQ